MSIFEQVRKAQVRWQKKLDDHVDLQQKWLQILPQLTGEAEQIQGAFEQLRSRQWYDAACSLLTAVDDKPLRMNGNLGFHDKISTISALLKFAAELPANSALGNLFRTGGLERFLLRLCTKKSPKELSESSYQQLLSISLRMRTVAGGEFNLGNHEHVTERPVHAITIDPFQVAVFPVTQLLWSKVMGNHKNRYSGSSRPAESLSWYDAVQFCNALSKVQNREQCYRFTRDKKGRIQHVEWVPKNDGYRLLTESEWETAAQSKGESSLYAGSDDIRQVGWCSQHTGTRSIGQKSANAYGLHDMSGNVFEWCWDWYGDYQGLLVPKSKKQPEVLIRKAMYLRGNPLGEYRVYRGGCWNLSPHYARISARLANIPELKSPSVGLRIACSIV